MRAHHFPLLLLHLLLLLLLSPSLSPSHPSPPLSFSSASQDTFLLSSSSSFSLSSLLNTPNIPARFLRTALSSSPSSQGGGNPQYTFGAQNNTPSSPLPPSIGGDEASSSGRYTLFQPSQWTSGFFSLGEKLGMWMLYDQQQNLCPSFSSDNSSSSPSASTWLSLTQSWTDSLLPNINLTTTHDIGFLALPFESASTLRSNSSFYTPILAQMATNLAQRYVPAPGVIRSWNDPGSHEDSVLVIIDSVMNLPLLVRASQNYTQNNTFIHPIVSTHLDRLMRNNVREDGSTFHVCDYSATSGELYLCRTAQGLADNSTWARGQAWAIHGFTELYGLLGNRTYLDTARRAADWFLDHLPRDSTNELEVPYWDFDAPYDPTTTPRDVSAGMIAASGLLSLAQYDPSTSNNTSSPPTLSNYSSAAIQLLHSAVSLALATPITFSEASTPALGVSTNITTSPSNADTRQFESVFMHSTVNGHPGTRPGSGGNYDTGLIYADTYSIEAVNKLLKMGYVSCNGTLLAKSAPAATSSAASTAHLSFRSIAAALALAAALLTTYS